ncbi:hypothetical protein EYC84_000165 [Monilinia fructicola]|uniref:Uncharacterized protein n=1 Tax=Monilinia fructicola TaxID=38448 RepID=A0A5M9JNC9_MONFR|nr:hypothetical protein EYC84_000165 [Monilinia fructicola]
MCVITSMASLITGRGSEIQLHRTIVWCHGLTFGRMSFIVLMLQLFGDQQAETHGFMGIVLGTVSFSIHNLLLARKLSNQNWLRTHGLERPHRSLLDLSPSNNVMESTDQSADENRFGVPAESQFTVINNTVLSSSGSRSNPTSS